MDEKENKKTRKKRGEPEPAPVAKHYEVKPIVPKYIRIDTARDIVAKKIWFCLTFLDETKVRSESVGGYSDRLCGKDPQTGQFRVNAIEGLPPFEWDTWNGFMWHTMEQAVQARELIRVYIMMKGGGLLEDI